MLFIASTSSGVFVNVLLIFLLCLQGYAFSEDGEYLAYGTSASGSDWVEIRFLRVEDAVPLEDRLERVKFSCMSWTHDGKGLFYNSYPDQEGKSDGEVKTASGCVQTNTKVCLSCQNDLSGFKRETNW